MATVEGVFITADDGHWLAGRLRAVGRAVDVILASRIEAALQDGDDIDCLDDHDRQAILHVLDVPPRLEQLRAVLELP